MRTVKPVTGYLLVKKLEPETQTKSGIHLPMAQKTLQNEGEIVTAFDDSPYKVGQMIVYKQPTAPIQIVGESFVIIAVEHVLGIITEG